MRPVLFTLFLSLLLPALLAVEKDPEPPAPPADPMAWTPPEGQPKIIERMVLDKSAYTSARIRLNLFLEDRSEIPQRCLQITDVTPDQPGAKVGLEKGDIVYRLDRQPVTDLKIYNELRRDEPQTLSVYSTKTGFRTVDIPAEKLSITLSDIQRDNPLNFSAGWDDPRWKEDVLIAGILHENSPELAESALAHAVAAGMKQDASVNRQIARLNFNAFRYDDAMTFAYAALKENPDDPIAAFVFPRAAANNYKLEALANFLETHPNAENRDAQLEELERLITAHKRLPEAQRVCLTPRAAAKNMFKDDITVRGEIIPMLLWRNNERKPVVSQYATNMLVTHEYGFRISPNSSTWVGFKPAVKNIHVRFWFDAHVTDPTRQPSRENQFTVSLFPYDEARENVLNSQARDKEGLGLSLTPSSEYKFKVNHFSEVFQQPLRNQNSQLAAEIKLPTAMHEIVLTVVDGKVEMFLDQMRVFYGPTGMPDAKIFVAFKSVGMTGSLRSFDAYELLSDEERDKILKPEINKGYRNGMTRMHMAALHFNEAQMRQLLDAGATFDVTNHDGLTPLELAILESPGNYFNLKKLGAPVSPRAVCGAFDSPKKIPDELLNEPPKNDPVSPLHFVAGSENADFIKPLVDKGYDVNALSKLSIYNGTPLHRAVLHYRLKTASKLLEFGADPTLKDSNGKTALDIAKSIGGNSVKLIEEWQKGNRTQLANPENAPAPSSQPVRPPRPPDDVF